jgi:hypothetical protein
VVALTGGNAPASAVQGLLNGDDYVANLVGNGQQPGSQFAPVNVVDDIVNSLLSRENDYIRNARARGTEAAGARGLQNTSIAAGAGERAAIESAMPLFNEAMGLTRQREQLAFQGQESALDRIQGVNDAILKGTLDDWANDRDFTRQFNGVLSMMPINSAFQLNNLIQQYALENPEVYTPETISGMSNFFNQNMLSILQTYFPDMVGGA